MAASLFPLLQRGDADADHPRKFRLRLLKFLADRSNILRFENKSARGFGFSPMDASGLFDALDQFVKELLFHRDGLYASGGEVLHGMPCLTVLEANTPRVDFA